MTSSIDLNALGVRDLLRLYADILTVLAERGVSRSRNAPAGDLAEHLVKLAYDGALAPPSEKSWDVASSDGRQLQVKSRVVNACKRTRQVYSPFRSWNFDACVFVHFDAHTYEVVKALEVPVDGVRALVAHVPHVGVTAHRLHTRAKLIDQPGAIDVTERLRSAFDLLDRHPG